MSGPIRIGEIVRRHYERKTLPLARLKDDRIVPARVPEGNLPWKLFDSVPFAGMVKIVDASGNDVAWTVAMPHGDRILTCVNAYGSLLEETALRGKALLIVMHKLREGKPDEALKAATDALFPDGVP